MKNYEEFKKVVLEKFLDYIPEEYRNQKLSVHKVSKTNLEKDAIRITPPTKEISNPW